MPLDNFQFRVKTQRTIGFVFIGHVGHDDFSIHDYSYGRSSQTSHPRVPRTDAKTLGLPVQILGFAVHVRRFISDVFDLFVIQEFFTEWRTMGRCFRLRHCLSGRRSRVQPHLLLQDGEAERFGGRDSRRFAPNQKDFAGKGRACSRLDV